jgi:hypothetical protein
VASDYVDIIRMEREDAEKPGVDGLTRGIKDSSLKA